MWQSIGHDDSYRYWVAADPCFLRFPIPVAFVLKGLCDEESRI